MIYCALTLAFILANSVEGYSSTPSRRPRVISLQAAETDANKVTVRFINTPSGRDVTTSAEIGANLMVVGDAAGVKLPRACRTGLCGSCTCDMMDPLAIKTATNPRDGFATIRACSVKCFAPEGMDELVIDVYRMSGKGRQPVVPSASSAAVEEEPQETVDPMARFSGNWEKEFRPNWELETDYSGAVGGAASSAAAEGGKACPKCAGLKRLQCYNCDGSGRVLMGSGGMVQCSICVGSRSVGCGYCRGSGLLLARKTMGN